MSTIVQKIECLSRAGGLPGAENDACSFHIEEQAVALTCAAEKDIKRERDFFLDAGGDFGSCSPEIRAEIHAG